jgi:hypothetical protein
MTIIPKLLLIALLGSHRYQQQWCFLVLRAAFAGQRTARNLGERLASKLKSGEDLFFVSFQIKRGFLSRPGRKAHSVKIRWRLCPGARQTSTQGFFKKF